MRQQEIGYEVSHKELDIPDEEQKQWDAAMEEYMQWELEQKSEKRLRLRHMKRTVAFPYRWVQELMADDDRWHPERIIEAELSDYRSGSYPGNRFFKVPGKGLAMQQAERKGLKILIIQHHEFEDSYYGTMYFPLKDGRYYEVSYSC